MIQMDDITPLRVQPLQKKHVYSVCLYREPTYAERFPRRPFEVRYVEALQKAEAFVQRAQCGLRIFCDENMAELALSVPSASVYRVTRQAVEFPFGQHLWRYYSVLLWDADKQIHHFRGVDNLTADDLSMTKEFEGSGADLLHAPYHPFNRGLKAYMPVRGSCSVARRGVSALSEWLQTRPMAEPEGEWPNGFHCDEFYLREFFYAHLGKLNLFTLIDRPVPDDCWADMQAALLQRCKVSVRGDYRMTDSMRSKVTRPTPAL